MKRTCSVATKQKTSKVQERKKLSVLHKQNISKALKGNKNPLGCHRTETTKQKMSKVRKGKTYEEIYGLKKAKELKQNLSKVNKGSKGSMFGKRHSKATKLKISESMKGENHFLYKKTYEEFYGEKRAKHLKQRFSESHKGEKSYLFGTHLSSITKQKLRVARLKQTLPKQDTTIEVAIQQELSKRQIEFDTHVPLLSKYQVDILIGSLVIEADGNYWHNYPKGLEKDRIRDQALKNNGYQVLRFWGHEINDDVVVCVNKIVKHLR